MAMGTRGSRMVRAAAPAESPGTETDPEAPPPPPPFDPAKMPGALPPLGFFDPLGYSKLDDEDGFRKFRTAEIKHGRVAMIASIGAVGQHYAHFPGFDKTPKGIEAAFVIEGKIGLLILLLVAGFFELLYWKDDPKTETEDIGDYGNPLMLPFNSEDMRNRELNNGRFSMFAVVGIFAAELFTGKDAVQQLGFS
eukprot:TRINITY_DN97593_c0_g1_i1.p1 TRINITY_DN97593_c0_g1~~TRINITY_DN97593_c0_g1_i1.p1  ORF type:complete len:203 (+),score=61.64 TRINITY_DN97593_c0_g1_i1:30-611(+)